MTTLGLVGCGGGDASPTLALSSANSTQVASKVLVDSDSVSGISIPTAGGSASAFAPLATRALRRAASRVVGVAPGANATQTDTCTGGGTITTDSNATPGATSAKATITYAACVEGDATLNGKLTANASVNGTSITESATINLTITAGGAKIVESGDFTISFNLDDTLGGSSHITASSLSVAITSPAVTDKITLSDLDIATSVVNGESSATESYNVETQQLGGLFSVDTDTPVATASLALHPHAGQVTVTGAKNSKLIITVLGDESFTPPAGQDQVKLELDSGDGKLAAAVYVSWAQLESQSANIDLGGF
ncbi:MAG TPA: hypothetical protein VFP84_37140 [Kofleriaceae bacterium]|nr:hypothetical protein [Kofleriaceae bacterium]